MDDNGFGGVVSVLMQRLGIPALCILGFMFFAWLNATALNSAYSGWITLGDHYRAKTSPKAENEGKEGELQIGRYTTRPLTPIFFTASKEGLSIWTYWLFRFLQPSLLIPWREIQVVEECNWLLGQRVGWYLVTKQKIRLYVDDIAYAAITPYLTHIQPKKAN